MQLIESKNRCTLEIINQMLRHFYPNARQLFTDILNCNLFNNDIGCIFFLADSPSSWVVVKAADVAKPRKMPLLKVPLPVSNIRMYQSQKKTMSPWQTSSMRLVPPETSPWSQPPWMGVCHLKPLYRQDELDPFIPWQSVILVEATMEVTFIVLANLGVIIACQRACDQVAARGQLHRQQTKPKK